MAISTERKCVTVSVVRRLALLFRVKANEPWIGPKTGARCWTTSYERQLEMLTKVRRGGGRRGHQPQTPATAARPAGAGGRPAAGPGRAAVEIGRDDLAREALTRRAGMLAQITDIGAQRDALRAEEDNQRVRHRSTPTSLYVFETPLNGSARSAKWTGR
jgi:phage shock protein A